ncbi:hypothetical protein JOQ06_016572, partial [Pogonophryne albipinna]
HVRQSSPRPPLLMKNTSVSLLLVPPLLMKNTSVSLLLVLLSSTRPSVFSSSSSL